MSRTCFHILEPAVGSLPDLWMEDIQFASWPPHDPAVHWSSIVFAFPTTPLLPDVRSLVTGGKCWNGRLFRLFLVLTFCSILIERKKSDREVTDHFLYICCQWGRQSKNKWRNLLLHNYCTDQILLLGSTSPIERVTAHRWHLMMMIFAIDNVSWAGLEKGGVSDILACCWLWPLDDLEWFAKSVENLIVILLK